MLHRQSGKVSSPIKLTANAEVKRIEKGRLENGKKLDCVELNWNKRVANRFLFY